MACGLPGRRAIRAAPSGLVSHPRSAQQDRAMWTRRPPTKRGRRFGCAERVAREATRCGATGRADCTVPEALIAARRAAGACGCGAERCPCPKAAPESGAPALPRPIAVRRAAEQAYGRRPSVLLLTGYQVASVRRAVVRVFGEGSPQRLQAGKLRRRDSVPAALDVSRTHRRRGPQRIEVLQADLTRFEGGGPGCIRRQRQ